MTRTKTTKTTKTGAAANGKGARTRATKTSAVAERPGPRPVAPDAAAKVPRLTDHQLVALSAAAQRDDRMITVPEGLTGKARTDFAARLLRHGLARETPAKRGQLVWREDDTSGRNLALVVTDAGLSAIGHAPDEGATVPVAAALDLASAVTDSARSRGKRSNSSNDQQASDDRARRPASKQARLIAMLSGEAGCSINEAAAALGWLPHTTRAALTGLRRKGYAIERAKGEAGAASRHRIVATAAA